MRRLLRVLGCASLLTTMIGCSTGSDATTGTTETFAPVADTGSPADTSPPETTVTAAAPPSGSPVFSMVTAVTGTWPNPVSKEELPIADIDNKKLCALFFDGGAFHSVSGDYYIVATEALTCAKPALDHRG